MAKAKTTGFDQVRALYARVKPALHAASVPELQAEADELVAAQKAKVHVKSGATRESIRKLQGKSDLEVLVVAGGELTTKTIGDRTYEREVRLRSGDTQHIAKKAGGAGVTYDYALGEEFGNEHTPAHPFFYGPYRARRRKFQRQRVEAGKKAIEEVKG